MGMNISHGDIDTAIRAASSLGTNDGELVFYIIGCFDYTYLLSKEHHQTPFIYEIEKNSTSPDRLFDRIKPSDKIIAPADLMTLSNPFINAIAD